MTASAQDPGSDVRFVIIHTAGKTWNPKLSMFEQPYILTNPNVGQENLTHVNHYKKLLASGKLLMGGPFLDAQGAVGDQVGMMIPTEGTSGEDLRAFAADDPAVKAGVLEFEVRRWLIGMKQ